MSLQYQVPPPPPPCRKHYMGSIYCVYIHVCVDLNVRTKCLVDACITKMEVCVYIIFTSPGFHLEHLSRGGGGGGGDKTGLPNILRGRHLPPLGGSGGMPPPPPPTEF